MADIYKKLQLTAEWSKTYWFPPKVKDKARKSPPTSPIWHDNEILALVIQQEKEIKTYRLKGKDKTAFFIDNMVVYMDNFK